MSLPETSDQEEVFRRSELAGRLAQSVDGVITRDFSPCGVCIDRGTPQLFSHPERYFTYLQAANTRSVEALLLPLIADDHAIGTIWLMSHDRDRHFDAEDVRIVTSLADFTATALLLNQRQTQKLLAVNAQLETLKERNRVVQEAAELATWDWNLSANTVIWNEQHYRLLGLQPAQQEETADLFTQFVHPDDLASVREQLNQAIALNGIYQADFRIVRADTGEVRWMSGYGRVVETQDGQATHMAGVMFDSSDRHQTEETLRASEEQLRLASQAANFGVYECIPQVMFYRY